MVKKTQTPIDGEIVDESEQIDADEIDTGGRPEHEPTAQQRTNVEVLAGYGLKHRAIAAFIGISAPTLRKHYGKELMIGDAKVQAKLGEAGLTMALGSPVQYYPPGHVHAGKVMRAEVLPDKAVLIFLMKTRLGLREQVDLSLSEEGRRPDDAEFNTAGITNAERVQRIVGLLDTARARRTRRASDRGGAVGTVPGQSPGSSLSKRS
jgi:hypothetical protein